MIREIILSDLLQEIERKNFYTIKDTANYWEEKGVLFEGDVSYLQALVPEEIWSETDDAFADE